MQGAKNFVMELFDLSFSSFVTVKAVKLLYVIAIVAHGLIALVIAASAFGGSLAMALFKLMLAIAVFLVGVIAARIFLELSIVLFRIESNTAELAGRERRPE